MIINDLCQSSSLMLSTRQYSQQYSHIYYCRLNQIKTRLRLAAQKKWPSTKFISRTLDTSIGEECFLIGTFFLDSPLKPNILDELEREYHLKQVSGPKDSYFAQEGCKFYIEDEHGRTEISFLVPIEQLVTGQVVAVKGRELQNGLFEVSEWMYCNDLVEVDNGNHALLTSSSNPEDCWIAILSGLKFNCSNNSDSPLLFELVKDFILESNCNNASSSTFLSVKGLIVCGNCLEEPPKIIQQEQKTRFGVANYKYDTRHFELFDEGITELLQKEIHVLIIPGQSDPTNSSIPQQPIHKNLFKQSKASGFSSYLHLSTNPSIFSLNLQPQSQDKNGVKCEFSSPFTCIATAGESVTDAIRHLPADTSPLKVVESFLKSSHIAPTAPDTLSCYPFFEKDPFVLEKLPNVFFCGNQKTFEKKVFFNAESNSTVNVLMVPDFTICKKILLFNVKTNECKFLTVDIDL